MLSDDTIAATLRRHADPQQAADTLVDMANQAGGDDNITVVVLDALADGAQGGGVASAAVGATRDEPTGEWHVAEAEGEAEAGDNAVGAGAADGPGTRVEPEPEPALDQDLDPEQDLAPAGPGPAARPHRLRSVLLWGLPILAVVGIAVGAIGWYARRTYYVGLSADRVTLFQGVPGGLLGWQPTVDRRTELTAADLTPADRADLQSGHRFANRSDATRFLTRLEQAHEALAGTTTTSGPDTGPVAPGEPGPTGSPSSTVQPTP
jgi:protein phosphatase